MSLTAPVDSMLIQDQSLVPLPTSSIPSVNVAAVPQRSPLRYPGGKTWLIPHIRAWLTTLKPGPELLVEPFAGGGIVSLTAVMEGLAARCLMAEISDVAPSGMLHSTWAELTRMLTPTRETVSARHSSNMGSVPSIAPGEAAAGASLRNGITSRWYPQTLQKRLGYHRPR